MVVSVDGELECVMLRGGYRQEMAFQFNDVRYRKRQLIENKFSVLKRKFLGDLKARIFAIQKKEIARKIIVCNIHRSLQFLVSEVFYRAIYCNCQNADNQNGEPILVTL